MKKKERGNKKQNADVYETEHLIHTVCNNLWGDSL